ncbi:MAG: DNA cytosine methyltransferase [Patescibacteria group bacterium]
MIKKIVALSIFSGCGGLDIGSHLAGVPVLACLDFDKDCTETLKANYMFNDAKIFHEDITDFNINEFKKILEAKKYDKFILIGGPPCQPFSKAGYWVGNKARKKDKDPRNMVNEYLNIVKKLRPDGFLFENVESLLHPSNKHVILEITKFVASLGYHYKIIRVNALDFGVPQKRKRIIILGSKKEIKGEPEKTHHDKKFINARDTKIKPFVTTGDVIRKFDKNKYFEKEEVANNGTYYSDLIRVPRGKNYIALTKKPLGPHPKFKAGKRFWNFLLKLDPNEPSWTIAAQPGPWVGPFHWTSRRLRVPEIAAIQTFPEEYIFKGNRRSIQKQIGNAVPPVLGKKMIEFLSENI